MKVTVGFESILIRAENDQDAYFLNRVLVPKFTQGHPNGMPTFATQIEADSGPQGEPITPAVLIRFIPLDESGQPVGEEEPPLLDEHGHKAIRVK